MFHTLHKIVVVMLWVLLAALAVYLYQQRAVFSPLVDLMDAMQIRDDLREQLQVAAAKDAPMGVVTASVATATAVPQRESAWEELDLIKAARHALREARATGGNRVLRANLGMAGPPELVTRR